MLDTYTCPGCGAVRPPLQINYSAPVAATVRLDPTAPGGAAISAIIVADESLSAPTSVVCGLCYRLVTDELHDDLIDFAWAADWPTWAFGA